MILAIIIFAGMIAGAWMMWEFDQSTRSKS
jgi:hypothetical protein